MKDNLTILSYLIWGVVLLGVGALLNDIRDFDTNQFKNFISWAKTADKNEHWWTSKNAIEWSYYAISMALYFFKGYLIYGVFKFTAIIDNVKNGDYFSDNNITLFKKIGSIFITYAVNVFILKAILSYVAVSRFKVGDEFMILVPAGVGLYVLASIFKRAKELKEENELTI
ncbi:DUF2975 domain-containing protein [Spongiivirga citrea]|uniref:DUF2975 domain-containing protein n=1 Tax=Spongiivirga citrea TaxID=1481457 RepID=A0A6M0CH10_9FLAO|nr:DUF2975 domain-containing protein [Spongiivirga citrea]NER17115.1 DUF2975 domain-containing protein [Spongiivirga citrea]